MDLVASIIGIFAVCLLIMYIAFNLDETHFLLKLLLFFVFLVTLPLIPKVLIDNQDHCTTEIANTTITGNVTAYEYTRQCTTNTTNTYNILYRTTTWLWYISIGYMIIFLSWRALLFFEIVVPRERGQKKVIPYRLK